MRLLCNGINKLKLLRYQNTKQKCRILIANKKLYKKYNYIKGPDDPTYISVDRAMYIYHVTLKELENLHKIKLRSAHNSTGEKMICYLEKDVEKLCRSKGNVPRSNIMKNNKSFKLQKNNHVLITAIISNSIIFVSKAVVYYYTGSTSLLAESIHSLIDIMNQVVLGIGLIYSVKAPTFEHPYGWSRARQITALISSVSALIFGTTLTISEGIYSLYRHCDLCSLNMALSVLLISFIVESWSFKVVLKTIINDYKEKYNDKIISKQFYMYLSKNADPINMAILMEDFIAIAGIFIALICVFLSYYYKSSIPDSIGSILVGILLGLSAYILSKRNINFLLERSIDRSKLEAIIDEIEADKLVRSVHDVKATLMGDGTVKFKAEINFDGGELAKAFLYRKNGRYLLKQINDIKNIRQLNQFTIKHTKNILNCLGRENDRIEQKLKNKFPELRHIDLETL